MIVMKFGGTSVADADGIRRLTEIVRRRQARAGTPPLVVVSAMAGVTDQLLRLVTAAERRDTAFLDAEMPLLRERHRRALDALVSDEDAAGAVQLELDAQFDVLQALLEAVTILREASPRAI